MSERTIDRRTYVKTVATTGTVIGLAGCQSRVGGGGPTTIVPGTAPGFPPFEMTNDEGEIIGFDVDLLSAVVAETDSYELGEWQDFEFSGLIQALTSDKIDVIAAAMTITDKRDQTIDFSDPYYNADQAVLVRSGGDFSPSSVDDLVGHPLGAQKGTTGESQIQSKLIEPGKLKESNYNGYDSYVLAVEDLINGNIDAIVIDTPVAQTFAAERDVEIAFTIETGERYGFGIREDDDALQEALNSGLSAVQDSGQYQEITAEWFGQ